MNPFEGLRRLFTDHPTGFAPIDDKFVRPNREASAKSMRLKERGKEQGELDLPPSKSADFDIIEREIVAEVGQHLDDAHIDACNHIRVYETRLSDLELLHSLGEIKGETRKTLGDIQALVDSWADRLSQHRDALKLSSHELKEFRRSNGLVRPFHLVESRWTYAFYILGAWFAETAGNTIFLSENNQFGIMGGMASGALVSLINVTLATLIGIFVIPWKNVPRTLAKCLAWLGIISGGAIITVWNLAAGHFRDAQSGGLNEPSQVAIQRLLESPFGFESLYSWGMLLIGVAAALLAAHQGYKMDDPFPGYGELGRRHVARESQYAKLLTKARENLADERDKAIKVAREIKDELGVQFRERGRVHAAHGHLLRRFEQHREQLDDLANYLLKVYRDENRKTRTSPPPKHFDEAYGLRDPVLPPLIEVSISQRDVEEAERALLDAIDSVGSAFDVGLRSFVPLDELKKGLPDGAI